MEVRPGMLEVRLRGIIADAPDIATARDGAIGSGCCAAHAARRLEQLQQALPGTLAFGAGAVRRDHSGAFTYVAHISVGFFENRL